MKLLGLIKKITNFIVGTFYVSLVILVFLQVIFRFVLQDSQPWIDELSRYLFVWLIYLGGTITVRKGINITFDLLIDASKGKIWTALFTLVNVICIAFLSIISILGFNIAYINRVQTSSLLGINMGLITLAIPVGGMLMIISQIEYYFETKRKRKEGLC